MKLMGCSVGGHLRRIGAKSAAPSAVGKQLAPDGCDTVLTRAALLPQQAAESTAGTSQHFTVTQTASPARRLGPLVHIGTVLNLMHKSEEEEIQTIV